MGVSREELKAKLLVKAEAAIDALVQDGGLHEHMTLSEIEQMVGKPEAAFRQAILDELLVVQHSKPSSCPLCGGKLENKGKRRRQLVSLGGEAEIERGYYQCQTCNKGYFPLDRQLGLKSTVYSPALAKQMVWLSGIVPYEQGAAVFERIGGRLIPASSLWRQSQQYGAGLQQAVESHRQQVSVERVVLPNALHDHDQRKGLSLDGGMVNIRGQGWRELKVGAAFDIETRRERDPCTQEWTSLAQGVNVHYTAVLGSKEAFTPALWTLAVDHDVPTAKERAVVGDGGLWVWSVAEDVCPDGRQIVDWFHATQHLAEAAQALYPADQDSPKRLAWLKTYTDHLYVGRVHKIIAVLKKRQRGDLALYFERHQRRMQYLEFREEGFPIGSGTVESGVKQFKQQLAASGMRWTLDNANRMLVIRAAVLSNDFDALWLAA